MSKFGRVDRTALFNIVVPCYNCEKTLSVTMESLLQQSCRDFRIVLVDDGSTDETAVLCDNYAKDDTRITVLHQKNQGLMRAWKNGVLAVSEQRDAATGNNLTTKKDYIIFCDSDDYVDSDLIERLQEVIVQFHSGIVLYGMRREYPNGDYEVTDNRIIPGYYDRERLEREIFPCLYSDGRMESELILKSRCSKAFRKELLLSIMDDLPDGITVGEDDLTTFCAVLKTDCIYAMEAYTPYHYVRNEDSMIGSYDPKVFEKLDLLYENLEQLAEKYDYPYLDQIRADQLSTILLYMKKEICRNPNGYRAVKAKLQYVRKSESFTDCLVRCGISNYQLTAKLFATLLINRQYLAAYVLTRMSDRIIEKGI